MRALVISDSHGATDLMSMLMSRMTEENKPDVLIYCGDGLRDVYAYKTVFSRFEAVRGNCDLNYPPEIALEKTSLIGDMFVFIAHGHAYKVKRTMLSLNFRAREVGAKVACFGHTHQHYLELHNGVLMLNPGALCKGCYAFLDIDRGNAHATLMTL